MEQFNSSTPRPSQKKENPEVVSTIASSTVPLLSQKWPGAVRITRFPAPKGAARALPAKAPLMVAATITLQNVFVSFRFKIQPPVVMGFLVLSFFDAAHDRRGWLHNNIAG